MSTVGNITNDVMKRYIKEQQEEAVKDISAFLEVDGNGARDATF